MTFDGTRGISGRTRGGKPKNFDNSGSGRVPLTVVFTSIEGTLAGLNAAADLSKGLRARIVILVAEVISFRYLIQGPPDTIAFFQRLCAALVKESGLEDSILKDVSIEVHLCRNRLECLAANLKPRSIVLVGAKRCWYPWRERYLRHALSQRGFSALLIEAPSSLPGSSSETVVQRMVEKATKAGHS